MPFVFVTTAFVVFDSPAWVVSGALAAHGLWDLAHLNGRLTKHTGDDPIRCAALAVTAAEMLLIV